MSNELHKLGIVLNTLGPGQAAYQIITSANRLLTQRQDVDISLFYKQLTPFVAQPHFATYHFFELFNYDGPIVCTDIFSAARVLSYPGPNRHPWIYLYCVNLDWISIGNKSYEQLAQIYLNPKIQLIARSEDHQKIIESVWKKCFCVVGDCNVSKLAEMIFDNVCV